MSETRDHSVAIAPRADGKLIQEMVAYDGGDHLQETIATAAHTVKWAIRSISAAFEVAAANFSEWIRSLVAAMEAEHELNTALRWAACSNRPLYNRYRRTKKTRTRKKYAKRILAWYREEILQC